MNRMNRMDRPGERRVTILSILLILSRISLLGLAALAPATLADAQTAWPRINEVSPYGAQRGTTADVTIKGMNIGLGTAVLFEGEGLTVESVTAEKPEPPPPPKEGEKRPERPKNPEGKLVARVRIAPDAAPGIRALRVLTPVGVSEWGQFVVGLWPELEEKEPNNARNEAQAVTFPTTVIGRVDPGEDVDCYRFPARAGQTLVFDVLASRLGWPLDSILSVQDASGREVARNEDFNGKDSLLVFPVPADGDYTLVLRDLSNRGGGEFRYRLSMGAIPYVTGVFPLGGRPGATVPVELIGVNLGPTTNDQRPTTNDRRPTISVTLPDTPEPALVPVLVVTSGGAGETRTLAVNPAPEVMEVEPNDDPIRAQLVPVPSVVNGRVSVAGVEGLPAPGSRLPAPGSRHSARRPAPGTRHPAPGAEASTASLRPNRSPGDERSDADCYRFRAEKGQKILLEVIARRCGSQLDSLLAVLDRNGKELAANDDEGGKDSRLEFQVPESGEYIARVTDLQERDGPDYGYRLQITIARPDFRLTFTPERLDLPRGDRVPVKVTAQRLYGFDGEISLALDGLPPGVSVLGPARIAAGQKETTLVLAAATDAPLESRVPHVTGTATIDGTPVRHIAQGLEEIGRGDEKQTRPGKLITAAVTEPGDLTLAAATETVTLTPGGSVEIPLKLARRETLKGKLPLILLGLPPGVSADAPEIDEGKSEAKVTLKADGGAQPAEASIVLMTRVDLGEGRQRFHCAAPITVKVAP
jgi:hypothetical protein